MTLADLQARGILRPLDRHVAELLPRLVARGPEGAVDAVPEPVRLAAAFASRGLADGHVCLDLRARAAAPLLDPEGAPVEGFAWPEPEAWVDALRASPVVGDGAAPSPLVLRGHRVWLGRYFAHERRLAAGLLRLATTPVPPVDGPRLEAALDRLFRGKDEPADQQAAVRAAAGQALVVLAGGPGTGKTTTVVRLVAAVLEQAAARGQRLPRVLLLAPTGKAAARLATSVRAQVGELALDPEHADAVRAAVPTEARTLHRALGPRNDWLTRMQHDADDPWSADLVVLDEASMVDLPLMVRAIDAIAPGGRLVLLGDPNQLAAVGAGAVLADLAAPGVAGPVGASVVRLRASRRFTEGGPVGRLAQALDAVDPAGVEAVLAAGGGARHVDATAALDRDPAFLAAAVEGFRAYASARTVEARLALLERFRILCATRVGPNGVEALNRAVEAALARARLIDPRTPWYEGRPVLVTANDYGVELFNGDLGVVGRTASGDLRVFFDVPGGPPRAVLPTRLPAHETVWAMTVHKSQGSECEHVAVALPHRDVPVLTKELLYTAVTRAKKTVTIWGDGRLLRLGLARRSERSSGLREAIAELSAV
jgi:exodeoxyribonuclease V alpha subunit